MMQPKTRRLDVRILSSKFLCFSLPVCGIICSGIITQEQIAAITHLSLSTSSLGRIKGFQGVLVGKATKILTIG